MQGAALLLFSFALGTPASGQEGTALRAHLDLEPSGMVTGVLDGSATAVGGGALLSLGGPVAFGGEGWLFTGGLDLDGAEGGTGLRLHMAYAGVSTRIRLLRRNRLTLDARGLLGAGNARVQLAVVGAEIASDNFLVAAPALGLRYRLRSPVSLLAAAGYRFAVGVEDLPGVLPGQLEGFTLSVGLSSRLF